jgi:CBS domain-containing protein
MLAPDAELGAVLLRTADSTGIFDAWPVGDENGLLGMIRSRDVDDAVAAGESHRRVDEFLAGNSEAPTHVHSDQTLSLALERMGASGLNVIPVVSRANVRQLIGVIALADILHAYGVLKAFSSREQSQPIAG